MKSLAAHQVMSELYLFAAEVKGRGEGSYLVLMKHGLVKATRAAGCLLEPEIGDLVLTAVAEDGQTFILNVLTRTHGHVEAKISSSSPDLRIEARRLRIDTEEDLAVFSPQLAVQTEMGRGKIDNLQIEGHLLENRFDHVTVIAKTVERVAERVIERLGRVYRQVTEFEESRVGRLRLLVDGLLFLCSKNTNLRSEKRVKIDAEKIHLG